MGECLLCTALANVLGDHTMSINWRISISSLFDIKRTLVNLFFNNRVCNRFLIILFFNTFTAEADSIILDLGFGYENIYGLTQTQSDNLIARIGLLKEFLIVPISKSDKIYLGFEVAARNGFYGSLNIPDEIQDYIEGPTPIVSSSPAIEFLTTTRKDIGETRVHFITKFGFDFSVLKFDRYDLASLNTINILGYAGLGFKLNKKNGIYILASSSKPLSKLNFSESSYSVNNPYSQKALLIGFVKIF